MEWLKRSKKVVQIVTNKNELGNSRLPSILLPVSPQISAAKARQDYGIETAAKARQDYGIETAAIINAIKSVLLFSTTANTLHGQRKQQPHFVF